MRNVAEPPILPQGPICHCIVPRIAHCRMIGGSSCSLERRTDFGCSFPVHAIDMLFRFRGGQSRRRRLSQLWRWRPLLHAWFFELCDALWIVPWIGRAWGLKCVFVWSEDWLLWLVIVMNSANDWRRTQGTRGKKVHTYTRPEGKHEDMPLRLESRFRTGLKSWSYYWTV